MKFANILFNNYDYAEDPSGPGTGLYRGKMNKYKSVADFLKKKRTKKQRRKAALLLAVAFPELVEGLKYAEVGDENDLQDPYEDQGLNDPLFNVSPAEVAPLGMLDGMYPQSDLEGKPSSNLYYGINETHEYAGADDGETGPKPINYYQLGFDIGTEDVKNDGFGSDILSAATALISPYTLDPNSDNYRHDLLEFAKGYIKGSKMPEKGNGYGSAEGELRVLIRHLQQVEQFKEQGKELKPGEYIHP